ncbi:MAG: hypothetical protein WDA27_11710 [Actinomycetota bacterium]
MSTSSGSVVARRFRRERAAAAAVIAVGLSLIPIPGARAESLPLIVEKTAWFWSSNSKVTTCSDDPAVGVCGAASITGGVAGNAAGTASPISPGHLGVSMKDGGSDMRSYVFFNLADLPDGAEVSRFLVQMNVSLQSGEHIQEHASKREQPPATSNQATAAIQACAVTEPWGPAEGDPPYSTTVVRPHPESADTTAEVETVRNEPFTDCSLSAGGTVSKDGAVWTFDITHIVKKWTSGEMFNEGVALMPVNTGVAQTWTVEFHGKPTTVAAADGTELTYVAEKDASRAIVEYTVAASPPSPPPSSPPTDGSQFPSFGNPIPIDDYIPQLEVDVPSGIGTGGASGTERVVPIAANPKTPAWVFGVIPLGILGLGLVTSVIGEDPVPVGAGGFISSSRVAALLRRRRMGSEDAEIADGS